MRERQDVSSSTTRSVIATEQFQAVFLSGVGWGELGIILAVTWFELDSQMTTMQLLWRLVPAMTLVTSILVCLGFLLALQPDLKSLAKSFLISWGAGLLMLAVSGGLIILAISNSSRQSVFTDFGSWLQILLLIPMAVVIFGHGFALSVGILLSISRLRNPSAKLRSFMAIGIGGAAAGVLALGVLGAYSEMAPFRYIFAILFFLCPATMAGSLFLIGTD
jgi:hypothetical protein